MLPFHKDYIMPQPSKDAVAFGFDRAYAMVNSTAVQRELLKYAKHQPVSAANFSITNPIHVCSSAYLGFPMMPYDEKTLKESIGPNGAFTRTVKDRVKQTQDTIDEINRTAIFAGFQLAYDPDTPTDIAGLELLRPMLGDFVDRLPLFDQDMAYMNAGRAARLHHFAREYSQPNVGALNAYLRTLNEVAISWGVGSFSNLNVPTKYMDYLAKRDNSDPSVSKALELMEAKRHHLKTESPYIIDLFVQSHANRDLPYFVDVVDGGVLIEVRHGSQVLRDVVKSKFITNDGSGLLQAIMAQPF
jgi:hypothetical protein